MKDAIARLFAIIGGVSIAAFWFRYLAYDNNLLVELRRHGHWHDYWIRSAAQDHGFGRLKHWPLP